MSFDNVIQCTVRDLTLLFTKRQNFGRDQIESICRQQIKRCQNDDLSL